MGKSTRRTNYKNSVTNLEIKLKYKQRTSYLHCVYPPLTVGSGGRPFYQIFKGRGGGGGGGGEGSLLWGGGGGGWVQFFHKNKSGIFNNKKGF